MRERLTGIVLAGGHAQRLGQSKPLLMLGGKLMLARVSDTLKPLCRELVLVVRPGQDDDTPDIGIALGMHVVTDTPSGRGPLAALHAGLTACITPLAFVTGTDYPFLSRRLIMAMATHAMPPDSGPPAAVVPRAAGGLHPLHAVYPVAEWLPLAARSLSQGGSSPRRLVEQALESGYPPVNVMTEDEVEAYDPQLLSLFDIDTLEHLSTARRIVSSWGQAVRPEIRPGGL
jgi:molybdopterin-guanine dinucleotide biosynthesis protein A